MRIGLLTGSGAHDWPGLHDAARRTVATEHGPVDVVEGTVAGAEVVQVSRHGPAHERLSHQVTHKANLAALLGEGVDAVIAVTVCGAVDPTLEPGTLVVFDDLYFPTNRLPDGSACTWFDQPGAAGRGHWIFDRPFSEPLRQALLQGHPDAGILSTVHDGGCYGHVDGPRFNTRTEIAALAQVGVTAVSQTAGPEVVLAGEAGLPLALVGFVTDYANGVASEPEPVQALLARLADSATHLARLVERALPHVGDLTGAGVVHRVGP
ncbi:MTAP family purine nucleoside phosphorylase [Segeticoccus rhizosphaerae]|jgi:5'-methylthioadenosine phosphorylase|uniref:MTAP family purine nucleoside phosphorylase n=1 Tax=Segeticoccus rhizosphaerae TaxID=1104777 RepID=UPI0010C1306C|nr:MULTISPECIES: MTAP family purine nucleoside phosphorylase [Intrasporangiaceae]